MLTIIDTIAIKNDIKYINFSLKLKVKNIFIISAVKNLPALINVFTEAPLLAVNTIYVSNAYSILYKQPNNNIVINVKIQNAGFLKKIKQENGDKCA